MSSDIFSLQQYGKFLQIYFSEGYRTQISKDFRDWEYIKRVREGNPEGRQMNFLFLNGYGPAAVQYRSANFTATFPTAQQNSSTEHTALYKEINTTIELEYNVWERARLSPNTRYAEPLMAEMEAKMIASKRRLAADLYADGTGVVGTVLSASDAAIATGDVVVTLDSSDTARGFVGMFEYDDILLAKNQAGAAVSPTGAAGFYGYRVKSRDRAANTVTLTLVDASYAVLTTGTASNLVATNVFYRVGQTIIPNLAAVGDYGSATDVIAGLESLAASDGRLIHGITMSGRTAGSEFNASGDPLDVSHIHSMMDNAKIAVGNQYEWKQLVGSPESQKALIESREADRRFISMDDHTRGVKKFIYQHLDTSLEVITSEFCPKTRMYAIPEGKQGNKVIEYHGTDFTTVKAPGGQEVNLKPSSAGGHERRVVSYLMCLGVLVAKHPAAIARLRNFTV